MATVGLLIPLGPMDMLQEISVDFNESYPDDCPNTLHLSTAILTDIPKPPYSTSFATKVQKQSICNRHLFVPEQTDCFVMKPCPKCLRAQISFLAMTSPIFTPYLGHRGPYNITSKALEDLRGIC